METNTYADVDSNFKANSNWFEIWSLQDNGALNHCVNFYDVALRDVVPWVTQCFSQESSRTDEIAFAVVHSKKDIDGTISRSIIPEPAGDVKLFTSLKKYRESLRN
jgi:hypothetical protein